MTEREKDNRAARRRESTRQMRALLERLADRSPRPLSDMHAPCLFCKAVLDHAGDCLWLETRRWLDRHPQQSSFPAPTRTSR